jgi:hypothetical protein
VSSANFINACVFLGFLRVRTWWLTLGKCSMVPLKGTGLGSSANFKNTCGFLKDFWLTLGTCLMVP